MTPDRLQEIRQRLEKRTQGEWQAVHGDSYCAYPIVILKANGGNFVLWDTSEDAPEDYPGHNDDADFIAHAPQDITDLLAALATAEAEGRRQAEALKEIAKHSICEDNRTECYQASGPYCGAHTYDDDLVQIARAALRQLLPETPHP